VIGTILSWIWLCYRQNTSYIIKCTITDRPETPFKDSVVGVISPLTVMRHSEARVTHITDSIQIKGAKDGMKTKARAIVKK
jgi:hypothetical protein